MGGVRDENGEGRSLGLDDSRRGGVKKTSVRGGKKDSVKRKEEGHMTVACVHNGQESW